jgi:CRISPR-associated endonuclease/helicase Cas3
LIYFDDSFGFSEASRKEFVTFVQFLYAQDLDIVVGSSSLPLSLRDDMAAFEVVDVKSAQVHSNKKIGYRKQLYSAINDLSDWLKSNSSEDSRITFVWNAEQNSSFDEIVNKLNSSSGREAINYRSTASRSERQQIYAKIKQLERENKGYILIADGPAFEASDFDVTYVISEMSNPLQLVRRAAKCNRHGLYPKSAIIVVGDNSDISGIESERDKTRLAEMTNTLQNLDKDAEYDHFLWESFLD